MQATINKVIDLISKLFRVFLGARVVQQSQVIKNLKGKIRVDEKSNEIDNRRVNRSDVVKWLQHDKNSK